MRVFVSEYVCGGAWPEERIATSLAREGRAMLTALVEDIAKIPGCEVVTTWDARLGICSLKNCEVHVVGAGANEPALFLQLVRGSDLVWLIAPESGGALAQRSSVAMHFAPSLPQLPRRVIGSAERAICQVSDKLQLASTLLELGIQTPPAKVFDVARQQASWWNWPIVIKPREGAGSQNTFLVRNGIDYWNASRELRIANCRDDMIEQPFVVGRAISVALLMAEDGSTFEVLPVADQHLSDDGRFRYMGGRIPADISAESAIAVQQLAVRACRAAPGLAGFVGCDVVLPDDGSEPVLIEINPRLTTSYLGYRQLTDDNIAARLLDRNSQPLRWKSEPVTFVLSLGESLAAPFAERD